MKYENAKDILPAKLLEEVQKYAEGKVIYIPRSKESKGWGEASGYRDRLKKRNALICSRYSAGRSVMEIAEEFFLSPETVKKLVYGKKVELPMFSPSVTSAEQYASAGMGEEWVRTFLETLGETMPETEDFFISELVRIPLRLIDTDDAASGEEDSFEVPLIVMYDEGKFSVPYQPGYLASLRKEKRNAHYAFVFARNEEYGFFWSNYGKNFRR
ncbi:MAG: hypothetical protein J5696_02070 [Lachnospiraceae bacterium]|nr:hypothetical protein [Lachnospiraceae bacterium]